MKFTLFANTINDSFQFRVQAIFEANRGLSREVTTNAKEVRATCVIRTDRICRVSYHQLTDSLTHRHIDASFFCSCRVHSLTA